ncbi:MAG: CDP-alcohol phosphatidyltransferase family protein [Anaerolineae bacterium]|nr:CDP-alcohol phosphatidyltransferase family protein [Anaerolineae bacterium]
MDRVVENKQEGPKTFTDYLRVHLKGAADSAAGFLLNLGLKPNAVTFAGLLGHIGAALLVVYGHMFWGGLVLLIMAPLDFLDGTMARMRGESSAFGAFVDSVTDRYSEFVIMGGLLIYYLMNQDWIACIGVYLAAVGSLMVSYIRSRGEGLGFTVKIGLLTRVERYIVLIPGLLFNFPGIAVWIIAVLANFTALQRIFFVRRESYGRPLDAGPK